MELKVNGKFVTSSKVKIPSQDLLGLSNHITCLKCLAIFIFILRNSKNVTYRRVHIGSDETFSKILKKPSILQKQMLPHMNGLLVFIEIEQLEVYHTFVIFDD